MSIFLIISIIELIIIVFLSIYVYRFAIKLLNIEDTVNQSLDILEQKYESISKVLDKPVFFDSVEVRQVISDIYDCQKAVYTVSIMMGENFATLEEIDDKGKEENTEVE